MKRIKFLRREVFETEGRNQGPVFEEDKSYDLDDDQAERWIRRGAARLVGTGDVPKPVKEVPEPGEAAVTASAPVAADREPAKAPEAAPSAARDAKPAVGRK